MGKVKRGVGFTSHRVVRPQGTRRGFAIRTNGGVGEVYDGRSRDAARRREMVTIGTKCGGSALRLGRMAVLCLGIAPVFGAQQSVQVTSGSPSVTLPNRAPWTTIGRSTNPMRWEVRIHGFGADFPAYPSYLVNLGPAGLARGATPNRIQAGFEWNSANTFDVVSNNGPGITGCCAGWNDVLVRVQRDVANQRYTIEACNGAGGACYSSEE